MELETENSEHKKCFSSVTEENRPNMVSRVPQILHKLGDVFFPIPRGQKAWKYAHHLPENRYSPSDEVFNAYLEAGWGYGISCANQLAVVDVDEKEYIDEITDNLPETVWQKTGSRSGYHLFYLVSGLDQRIMLYDETSEEKLHVGEVKCDPHGYVVGPGSVHPSGEKYGPLHGDEMAVVTEAALRDGLDRFIEDGIERESRQARRFSSSPDEVSKLSSSDEARNEFYRLSADDVLPWLDTGERISHPVHGSSTGSNFMKNEGGDTFTCWRCQYGTGDGCGISPQQLLVLRELKENPTYREMKCSDVRRQWSDEPRLHYIAWRRAVRDELVDRDNPPYKALLGYSLNRGIVTSPDSLEGELYWTTRAALQYEFDVAGV